MIFKSLRGLFAPKETADRRLYEAIVAAARQPAFYSEMKVPDNVDGRFEMIVLHMYLVLGRLKGDQHAGLRQALTDEFFKDMDRSLREMGTGDLSVSKKVRKMAEAFFGRIKAYEEAADEKQMREALSRNVFAEMSDKTAGDLARAVFKRRDVMAGRSDAEIVVGQLGI